MTSRLRAAAALCCVACSPEVTSVGAWSPEPEAFYLEAEEGELRDGFGVVADVTASNGAYLAPPAGVTADDTPGEARARYVLDVDVGAVFTLWGRIRSPDVDSNRFWFRIGDGPWYKWRISVGDIWYWDDFHDDTAYGTPLTFELAAGAHELWIANASSGAALDRLYVSPEGAEPPENDTPCDPPHSIERAGVCLPSCGSQNGTTCGVQACAGKLILPAYDCDVCCREGLE